MTQATLRVGVALLLASAVWLCTIHGAAILLDLRTVSGIFCF